jgi:ABC-type transporter Mla subunit MlaD
MSYVSILQRLPPELQLPMVEVVEALRKDLRQELAVRREDFVELRAAVRELAEAQRQFEARAEARFTRLETALAKLAEAQRRTEQRLDRLEQVVQELAEAQKRTEQRVQELAEAQKRTEQRLDRLEQVVQELAEAQRRTEQRLDRLEQVVQELAEAQKRTEQQVQELAEAQKRTEQRLDRLEQVVQELAEAQKRMMEAIVSLTQRMDAAEKQLGQLSERFGLDLEVDAEEVLRAVVQEKGYSLLQEPMAIDVDGEMDVVAPIETPSGERFWMIIEVKGRLRRKEVGKFLQRLQQPQVVQQLEASGVGKPYLPYVFGLRVYFGVDDMARETGIGILTFRGERIPARIWE